jgi:catalase (peroxidase I)
VVAEAMSAATPKFVQNVGAAWPREMNLDRFDLP